MTDKIIIYLLYAIVGSSLFFGLINLLRASLYDIRHDKLRREQFRHPNARHRRRRPLVSVIIYADNDASMIVRCLESVSASNYRKLETIVIDNASRDNTRQLVRAYIKEHPKQKLRLVARKVPASRPKALAGAARWAKGEAVLVINGSHLIEADTVKNLVTQLNEPGVGTVLPNVRVEHDYHLLGLSEKFRSIATIWSKKSRSYILPGLDNYNHAALYRKDIWKLFLKQNPPALDTLNMLRKVSDFVYESDAKVLAHGSKKARLNMTLKRPISLMRALLNLAEPLVVGFMLYVAIRFEQPGYILLAWLSFTALLLLAIWSDDSQTGFAKIRLSFFSLITYSLYIIDRLLNLLAIIFNSFRRKTLTT